MSCFVRKFLKCSGFVFILSLPLLGLAQQVPMTSDSLSRGEVETWLRTGASQEGVKRIGAAGNSRAVGDDRDRKSTRLNSSHVRISYAVFCLNKKKTTGCA